MMLVLTAHGCGGLEDLGYFGVHLDAHVGLADDLLVSLLYLTIDPVVECLAHHRVDDVGQVLPRHLLRLLLQLRQALHHLRVHLPVLIDAVNGDTLEVWHVDVLDLLGVDHGPSIACQITEMPDGDGIVGWDVCMAVGADEPEDLNVNAGDHVGCVGLTSRLDLYLAPNSAAVMMTFLGFWLMFSGCWSAIRFKLSVLIITDYSTI